MSHADCFNIIFGGWGFHLYGLLCKIRSSSPKKKKNSQPGPCQLFSCQVHCGQGKEARFLLITQDFSRVPMYWFGMSDFSQSHSTCSELYHIRARGPTRVSSDCSPYRDEGCTIVSHLDTVSNFHRAEPRTWKAPMQRCVHYWIKQDSVRPFEEHWRNTCRRRGKGVSGFV